MASSGSEATILVGPENQQQQKALNPIQIYPTSNTGVVSLFWKEKYERDAKKYWDVFYKRHQDRFFKDRHYLDKEWGSYFHGPDERKAVLEVGCGAGNTIFPLVATFPHIYVHGCDFSPRAIDLVKSHKNFREDQVNAFVCDLTTDDLSKNVAPFSVDIVTMVFVLSAVAPERMPLVLQNVRKVLKPNGVVLVRDYALGDLAQERFTCKDQKLSENFYVRGDGTRAFYFSEEFLKNLFKETGFKAEELGLCCKQVENRSRELVMNRCWIQAVFCFSERNTSCKTKSGKEVGLVDLLKLNNGNTVKEAEDDHLVDLSESIAVEMFGTSPSINEIVEVDLGECSFRVEGLPRDYQHTCRSTGLMLWESARFMAEILARNPYIVAGKRVLELGCGCTGVCSMVAGRSAEVVAATDGDQKALDLLNQNVTLNLDQTVPSKLVIKRLEWGNKDHMDSIKQLSCSGFEVIIGTDVTYVPETLPPLFKTARELISTSVKGHLRPALILCYVLRRADETSILSAASQFGFRLVDRWPKGTSFSPSQSIISPWFANHTYQRDHQKTPLNILYFHI